MTASLASLALGAPGIYPAASEPIRMLTGVRMDVCAFAGVAPRGPARDPYFDAEWAPKPESERPRDLNVKLATPVAVESWSEYTRLFGSFEGPGLLPYAVSAFFDNGGRRAYIVRIVHQYFKADGSGDDDKNGAGFARAAFAGLTASGGRAVWVRARNEGSWGNSLRVTLSFTARTLGLAASDFYVDRLSLPNGADAVPGAVLRLFLGAGVKTIRRISLVTEDWNPLDGSRQTWAWFDHATASAAQSAELIEGVVTIDDGVNAIETFEHVGLAANHPRWLANVLVNDSERLYPCDDPALGSGNPLASWIDADLDVDARLDPIATAVFTGGTDRYADIVPEDFFDSEWVLGDDAPGCGVHALTQLDDLSLVVVPDLYSPGALAPIESIVEPATFAGAEFAECIDPAPPDAQGEPAEDLTGLRLDPSVDFDAIVALQRQLADLADDLESFIVLLDVPPRLSQKKMLNWRAKFDSAYAAAYYPWLDVTRADDARDAKIAVNPSAAAAGIIAQRETQFGVPYGPANVIATGVVAVEDRVSPARHAELHQNAVNVFVPERDGVRLTAARTLSRDPQWRQLNVRRLVTMIRRVLERQMQWVVFEPNTRQLRFQIARLLDAFLRQLYRANAFAGATEAEAFFVKCDDELNPPVSQEAGRLLAHVGVAPAEPLEFIVVNLAREGDSILTAEDH
ncbi:MAG: phage tail sheath subtilisin-like domain-containing protein [Acidobacteriia bacterium]|nr:phage tail sheath subtilisin-like domain-containing protein [Terriglobia bacterium]